MKRCADCGAKVEGGHRRNGWWTTVSRIGEPLAQSAVCRVVMDGNRMLSADYHYVEGEEQRHFTALDSEPD